MLDSLRIKGKCLLNIKQKAKCLSNSSVRSVTEKPVLEIIIPSYSFQCSTHLGISYPKLNVIIITYNRNNITIHFCHHEMKYIMSVRNHVTLKLDTFCAATVDNSVGNCDDWTLSANMNSSQSHVNVSNISHQCSKEQSRNFHEK